jgi:hypothetical protein
MYAALQLPITKRRKEVKIKSEIYRLFMDVIIS